jgi:YidC/Oxa1 family membrane protein insertase
MEKRIFLAVVISIAILALWGAVIPKLFPQFAKKEPPAQTQKNVKTTPAAATTTTATTTATTSEAPASGGPALPGPSSPSLPPPAKAGAPSAPVAAIAESQTIVDRDDFTARFTNRGGELVSFRLKHYRAKDGSPLELVKAREAERSDFPFAIVTREARLEQHLNTALYALTERTEKNVRVLEYRYSDGATSVVKTFRVGSEYQFDFAVSVTPPIPYRIEIGPGIRTLAPEERDSQFIITGNGAAEINDKLKVIPREKADRISVITDPDFVAVEDNYFLTALRPTRSGDGTIRRFDVRLDAKQTRRDLYAGLNTASDGTIAGKAFFGPKQTKVLETYGYASTLQFGFFGFIGRLLLELLIWMNGFIHNYGWSIIALTIIIKIVLYPLQHKSIVSMKRMQRVQPKVEAIRNRYKKSRSDAEQRQKMNTEMMKLYQQEGINPMGGCLPIALQLPILWGFYGLLSRAIELRGAPFMWWIHDLSAKDPYYITPILMTITMFIQQSVTPTTVDPAQRRMFLIMPLVFGWIFKEFPSGLVLYWLVQNVLTIVQQLIMNKYWKDHPAELSKD